MYDYMTNDHDHDRGNFTNILLVPFSYKCFSNLFSTYSFGFVIFCQNNIGAKADGKMLVKLIAGKA
jgi:hypothetical protein